MIAAHVPPIALHHVRVRSHRVTVASCADSGYTRKQYQPRSPDTHRLALPNRWIQLAIPQISVTIGMLTTCLIWKEPSEDLSSSDQEL